MSAEEALIQDTHDTTPARPLWRRAMTAGVSGVAVAACVWGLYKLDEKEPCSASFNIDTHQTSVINIPEEGALFGQAKRSAGGVEVAVGKNALYPYDFVQDISRETPVEIQINDDVTLVLHMGAHAVTSSCVFSKS